LVLGGAVPDMSSIFLLGVAVRSSFSLQVFSAPHPICLSFGFAALVFILSLTIFLRSSHLISPFRSARAPSRDSATTVPTRPVPARLSLDFSSAICSLVGPFVRSLLVGHGNQFVLGVFTVQPALLPMALLFLVSLTAARIYFCSRFSFASSGVWWRTPSVSVV
jgi:hypothetical protein